MRLLAYVYLPGGLFHIVVQQNLLSNIKQVLNAGKPVAIGIAVYDSFESPMVASTGLVPLPNTATGTMFRRACSMYGRI